MDANTMRRSEMTVAEELRHDVEVLAGEIGERNVWLPGRLESAAAWIEFSLCGCGLKVDRQGFEAEGQRVFNIEAELRGDERPDEVLILGAHYDSRCGMKSRHSRRRIPGKPGTPGADDNASGVAAILALARRFAQKPQPCTLRFVAFVNEEAPFFQTELMGSRVYAKRCRQRKEHIIGMLTPETLGYYTDARGSQRYPLLFGRVLSSRANFVAFLGNLGSVGLVRRTAQLFRRHSEVPAVGVAFPRILPRVGWSDDWSFWKEGYRALTITDTAYFRYEHYHAAEDTPEKLDYPRFAAVVEGLPAVVEDLCGDTG